MVTVLVNVVLTEAFFRCREANAWLTGEREEMGLPLHDMTRKLRIWNRSNTLMGRVMPRAGAGPRPMNWLELGAGTGTSE